MCRNDVTLIYKRCSEVCNKFFNDVQEIFISFQTKLPLEKTCECFLIRGLILNQEKPELSNVLQNSFSISSFSLYKV